MHVARLAARTIVGGLFVGHGSQKLFGWAGGPGLAATAAGFEQMGLRPGRRNAIVAGASEFGGGAALALGVATPLAGAALIGTMITAIRTVHWKNGPWNANGGYELNLVMIAAIAAIVDMSAPKGTGSARTLAVLAAGAVGSTLAIEAAHRS